jgi:ADP-ribose pyrophosphatase YjhB (NUDIX family)
MSYLSDEDYKFVFSKVPRLCVDLLVTTDNNEVLLVTRETEPHIGTWHLPGGMVGFGESLVDAAKRIAKREIGAAIDVLRQVGVIEFINEHSVSIVFECQLASPTNNGTFFKSIPEPMHPEHGQWLGSNDWL